MLIYRTLLSALASAIIIPLTLNAETLVVMKEDYGQFSYNTAVQSRITTQTYEDPTSIAVENLLNQSGIDYRIQLRHWPIAYRRATNRVNYALFPVERSEGDESKFEYIGPITQYRWVVYTRASSNLSINSLDDLEALSVGGYENSPFVQYLESEGVDVSTLPYDALNLKRLVLGYIDAWATYDENAERIAQEARYPVPKAAWTVQAVDIYLGINLESSPTIISAIRQNASDILAE